MVQVSYLKHGLLDTSSDVEMQSKELLLLILELVAFLMELSYISKMDTRRHVGLAGILEATNITLVRYLWIYLPHFY
jgi:hypothetical protein